MSAASRFGHGAGHVMVVDTHGPDETLTLATVLGCLLQGGDLLALSGDLGAGKTVFAKGIGRALGITDRIVSPTFTVVREYQGDVRLAHVDVYRLEHLQELQGIGWDDYLDTDTVVVVEWAERVVARLPIDRLDVRIDVIERGADDDRRITLAPSGPSWALRAGAFAAALDGFAAGRGSPRAR